MDDKQLNNLITALETGDHNYYHGDVPEAVLEGLKDLRDTRERMDEIKDILNPQS